MKGSTSLFCNSSENPKSKKEKGDIPANLPLILSLKWTNAIDDLKVTIVGGIQTLTEMICVRDNQASVEACHKGSPGKAVTFRQLWLSGWFLPNCRDRCRTCQQHESREGKYNGRFACFPLQGCAVFERNTGLNSFFFSLQKKAKRDCLVVSSLS